MNKQKGKRKRCHSLKNIFLQIQYRRKILLHLEEKIIYNYLSDKKIRKNCPVLKRSNNFDNAPQIKPTFWWMKETSCLEKSDWKSE